jgi:phosphoribosyl 1,2-cyclic phosphodiesterase
MRVRFWGVRGSCPSPVSSGELKKRLAQVLGLYAEQQAAGQDVPDLGDARAVSAWLDSLPPESSSFVGSNTPCIEFHPDARPGIGPQGPQSDGQNGADTAASPRMGQAIPHAGAAGAVGEGGEGGPLFVLDMGSGLRALGNDLMKRGWGRGGRSARIFLSHYHWDHIQGFPFFKPAYIPGNRLDIHSRHAHLRSRLQRQQRAPFFPPASWECMRAELAFHQMGPDAQVLDGVHVTSMELDHPSKSYAYRFEKDGKVFVYASDGAYQSLDDVALNPFVEFFREADLLVFDAQFSLTESFEKSSWGHSSAIIGLELASQARVKRMALFHHDPDADDAWLEHLLETAREYAANQPAVMRRRGRQVEMLIAREGQSLDF